MGVQPRMSGQVLGTKIPEQKAVGSDGLHTFSATR